MQNSNKDDLIYGIHPIAQLIEVAPQRILELFVSRDKQGPSVQKLINAAEATGIKIQAVTKNKLEQWFAEENHQGVVARIVSQALLSESDLKQLVAAGKSPLLLILDTIQDPHNLGACLRAADAAGVTAVLAPKDKSVGLTPTVRKVACGAAETVPFIQVSNLSRTMQELQQQGIWIAGAVSTNDSNNAKNIYAVDLTGPMAIVLGSEGSGLRQLTQKNCDYLVQIPMLGHIESLNVSVAAGICLYEIIRQRAVSSCPPK